VDPLVVAEPASTADTNSAPETAPAAAAAEGTAEEAGEMSARWLLPAVVIAALVMAPAAFLLAARVSRRQQ
jgi:hypothetical protein